VVAFQKKTDFYIIKYKISEDHTLKPVLFASICWITF